MRSLLTKVFPFIFYGLLFVFLAIYLQSIDYSVFKDIEVNWWYLVIAFVFGLFFRYWSAYIWVVLLKNLGAKNVRLSRDLLYVYAKSWLGRYIPGTAPWILGKIYFASQHGISKNKLAVSSLLEGALQIAVLLAISLLLLVGDARLDIIGSEYKLLMIVGLAACFVSLLPPVFNFFVSLAYRLFKRKKLSLEHYANTRTISLGAGMYTLGALINGVSLFFIAKAMYPDLGYEQLSFVIGAGTLASAVSMLAVFAPSGLGVREGIQLALLSIIMPTEIALLVTIATRLLSLVCDGCFYGISLLLKRPNDKQSL